MTMLPVTTADYCAYRDATTGCMDMRYIDCSLHDKVTGDFILQLVLCVKEEDKQAVRDGMYTSTVLACIDKHTEHFRARALPHKEDGSTFEEQERFSNLPPVVDPGAISDSRRANSILWQVTHIDKDDKICKVKGLL